MRKNLANRSTFDDVMYEVIIVGGLLLPFCTRRQFQDWGKKSVVEKCF